MNEIPTYTPPEGVHGPTLGRDLPDGCERMSADCDPMVMSFDWWSGNQPVSACPHDGDPHTFPPLKVGDRVQLTGTVEWVDEGGGVWVQYTDGGFFVWFPTTALTRVVDQ